MCQIILSLHQKLAILAYDTDCDRLVYSQLTELLGTQIETSADAQMTDESGADGIQLLA